MKRSLIIIPVLLLFGVMVSYTWQGDSDGKFNGLKTKDGMLLVYNFNDAGLTLDIKAENMEKPESETFTLVADGKILQVVPVPVDLVLSPDSRGKLSEMEILKKHREYENSYLNEAFKQVIKLNNQEITAPDGRKWLYWDFNLPKESFDTASVIITKQMYANTIVGSKILLLSCVVTEKDNELVIKNFFMNTLASLKTNNKPYDISRLQDSLKAVSK